MTRFLVVFISLITLSASAQKLVPESTARSLYAGAAYVNGTYIVAVNGVSAAGAAVGPFLARIEESGRLLEQPVLIGTEAVFEPRAATDGESALVAWVELGQRLRIQWLSRDGIRAGSPLTLAEGRFEAFDVVGTSSGYTLVFSDGKELKVARLLRFALTPSRTVTVPDAVAGEVGATAEGSNTFVAWAPLAYGFPCGCAARPVYAQRLDDSLEARGPRIELEPEFLGSIATIGERLVSANGYVPEWMKLSAYAATDGTSRDDSAEFGSTPRLAQYGNDTIVFAWSRRPGNIYYTLLDRSLTQRFPPRTIAATGASEHLLALAAGRASFLAVYVEGRDLVYRVVDLEHIAPAAPAPPMPIARSATATWTATVVFEVPTVSGAETYYLEATSIDGRDHRDVVLGADAKLVRFEFMQPSTTYRVRLVAEDANGHSYPSLETIVTTPPRFDTGHRRAVRR